MKVLLVNPNQFWEPPVVPIGLEYIASAVEATYKHSLNVLDLCFVENCVQVLEDELSSNKYDVVGFSIRNIDSVIAKNNKFFLKEFANLIAVAKNRGIITVAGGAACDADPFKIKKYLGVDYLIHGPGETAFLILLNEIEINKHYDSIINGWLYGLIPHLSRNPIKYFDYKKYFHNGGIAAFQISAGCPEKCHFCFERCTPVLFRDFDRVIGDIVYLIKSGYSHFHLADSEFNVSLEHAVDFLKKLSVSLRRNSLEMQWTLYMKPKPISSEFFDLLSKTGAYLITLSFESSKKAHKLCKYSYSDVEIFLSMCRDRGINVAVDMLSGAPGETFDELKAAIEFFSSNRPTRVNINTAFRVYPNTPLYSYLRKNFKKEKPHIQNAEMLKDGALFPVFYQKFSDEEVRRIIGNDNLFKIEGEEKGVNYQKTLKM